MPDVMLLLLLLFSLFSFFTLFLCATLLDVQPHHRVNDVAYARIHGFRLPMAVAAAAQQCQPPHRNFWIAKRVQRRRASSPTAMLASTRKIGCQMGIYTEIYDLSDIYAHCSYANDD